MPLSGGAEYSPWGPTRHRALLRARERESGRRAEEGEGGSEYRAGGQAVGQAARAREAKQLYARPRCDGGGGGGFGWRPCLPTNARTVCSVRACAMCATVDGAESEGGSPSSAETQAAMDADIADNEYLCEHSEYPWSTGARA
jgi:hypothetical protein